VPRNASYTGKRLVLKDVQHPVITEFLIDEAPHALTKSRSGSINGAMWGSNRGGAPIQKSSPSGPAGSPAKY
jgi:hypothetical protein